MEPYDYDLVEEIKPVVMEEHEFDYRDSSKFIAFWHTPTIIIPPQGTLSITFPIRSFSRTEKLLFETLMKEIKPVDRERKEFESRYESIILAHLVIFGLPEF